MGYAKIILCLLVVLGVAINVNSDPLLDQMIEKEGLLDAPLEDDLEPQKRGHDVFKDKLSSYSCRYIRTKTNYCKSHPKIFKQDLCYAYCRCGNILSKKSCNILHANRKCGDGLVKLYCRLTCYNCIRTYPKPTLKPSPKR